MFSTSAPKCQDSLRSICSKPSSSPPVISVPTKQFTTMESVKREHVQVLGFVSLFIRTIEKCATNMEDLMQAGLGSVDEAMVKDLEELLAYVRIQLATISLKRQKLDSRSGYSSRRGSSLSQSSSQSNARSSFRGHTDFKNQQRSSQPTRGGRGGRRK